MNAYATSTTVEDEGQVRVAGVPFAPGTQVEVVISQKRSSGEDFAATWNRVCAALRQSSDVDNLTDQDVQKEIDDYRAGR